MSATDFEPAPAKYELRAIAELQGWDDNPRSITENEYIRLQEHIRRLGVYKPLLINQNNIVLGGNQRLRALIDLGVETVMCAVVLTDNKAQMLEYALSDNDSMGQTDTEKLAELATINPIKTELYAINTAKLRPIQSVLDQHGPDGTNPNEPKCRQCPLHCGLENI